MKKPFTPPMIFQSMSFASLLYLLLGATAGLAQSGRSAYVNLQEIYGQMPENAQIAATLASYQAQLQNDYKTKSGQLDAKRTQLEDTRTPASKEMRQARANEVQLLTNEVMAMEEGLVRAYNYKESQLKKVVIKKVSDAIAAVALEKNYSGVMDAGQMIYFDKADDITSLVLLKLGITPKN